MISSLKEAYNGCDPCISLLKETQEENLYVSINDVDLFLSSVGTIYVDDTNRKFFDDYPWLHNKHVEKKPHP
jgi:hypothetical protein